MVVVIVVVMTNIFSKIQDYMVKNPDSLMNRAINLLNFDPGYKRFGIRK